MSTNDADRRPAAAPREAARLTVRGLACRRGDRVLFEDFDLDLAPGEAIWLRAANGFGKTTLLRALAGLARPEAGTVRWTRGAAHEAAAPALYLAHANALKDDLTVTESLRHLAALHAMDASETALADAIRRFGLDARRHAPIRTLSQGQRRRVALMRLCLSDPRSTWLLDEPYDALDADGTILVGELLAEHVARRGNVLLTSHVAPAFGASRGGDADDGDAAATLRSVQLDDARDAATGLPA